MDSNICIAWPKNNQAVVERIINAGENKICLCAPVKAELWYGACKSEQVDKNKQSLKWLFEDFPSFPFDDAAAFHLGEIRAHLAKQGTPIGTYDMQIAAIALANNLIVISHSTGSDEVISYVGIRADEPQREGYISSKPNIKAVFPFKEDCLVG